MLLYALIKARTYLILKGMPYLWYHLCFNIAGDEPFTNPTSRMWEKCM
jgi:hypothetical protein